MHRKSGGGPLRALITGFGPFPGVERNSSQWLAEALGRAPAPGSGAVVVAAVLPVGWEASHACALAWLEKVRPHVALHFGLSMRARGFDIETRAHNWTAPAPDAWGALPAAPRARLGAPFRLAASLNGPPLERALRRRGVPAALSRDAGDYICNHVFYHALHWASRQARPPLVGFVHVPPLADDAELTVGLSGEELLRGARLIVQGALALARRRAMR